jgi:uncharacterized protein
VTILRPCVLGALVVMTAAVAAAVDISGKWKTTIETPMGQIDYTYDFVVKGTTLTGKIQSSMGSSDVIDGKIDGEKVTFVEVLKIEGNEVRVSYAGQITSEDEIKFTRQVGDFATEQFVAKRAK